MAEKNKIEENIEDELISEDENQEGSKKNKKIKKILIFIISFLVLLIVVVSLFYIFSPSNEEETQTTVVETPAQTATPAPQTEEQPQFEEPKEEYNFDFNSLDPEKLNEQLALLTSKNIEQSKLDELKEKTTEQKDDKVQEPIVEEPKKEVTAEQPNTKEENTQVQENKPVVQNNLTQEIPPVKEEDTTPSTNNNFIKIINVAKIKGELKKNFLDKVISINPNVHLCRDNQNIIELYFGPFEDDSSRKEILKKLVNKGIKQAYELEMTQEEFNKRCNY